MNAAPTDITQTPQITELPADPNALVAGEKYQAYNTLSRVVEVVYVGPTESNKHNVTVDGQPCLAVRMSPTMKMFNLIP